MLKEEYMKTIQSIFAVAGGVIGALLGEIDGLLYALMVFIIIDYLTGVTCAVVAKQLSSEVGFRGIAKKVMIFALVIVGNMVDRHVIGDGSVVRGAVIMFYIANEGMSILENTVKLGLPVPQKLKDILAQLSDKEDVE